MAIFGYIKGFITRLYDVISFLIVLFLVYLLSDPLASVWKVYQYQETDLISSMFGAMINKIIIALILFIVLMIIKKIVGHFIKPLLKGLMHTFSLTTFVDRFLGIILSVIEGVIYIYLILVFIYIPFFENSKQQIENSQIAHAITQLVPEVSQSVMDIQVLQHQDENLDQYSLDVLTRLTFNALDLNLINEEDALKIFEEYILNQEQTNSLQLTDSQAQKLRELLENSNYSTQQIQNILSEMKG